MPKIYAKTNREAELTTGFYHGLREELPLTRAEMIDWLKAYYPNRVEHSVLIDRFIAVNLMSGFIENVGDSDD